LLLVFALTGLSLTLGRAGVGGTLPPRALTETNSTYIQSHIALETDDIVAPPQETGEALEDVGAVTGAVQYTNYEVQSGDTLLAIAQEHGVTVDSLIWNNPEVGADPDTLIIGESLLVPGTDGLLYDVRLGDTITDIAGAYGVSPDAIVQYAANDLESPDLITEGMVLMLPGAIPPPPPPAPEAVAPPADEAPAQVDPDPGFAVPAAVDPPTVEPVPIIVDPSVYVSYIWPVGGPLWSGYGPRWGSFHKGVDIGAGYGTAVGAAAAGQVTLATYRDNGYGMYVIVRHADGSETLYAHLSALYVEVGQYVNQGDAVGAVGCTGWCSGDHLHFEVWIGGTTYNPLNYLP
jgi:murein DD-endopeptidase MepM/ murein hydrolase activator NlpD